MLHADHPFSAQCQVGVARLREVKIDFLNHSTIIHKGKSGGATDTRELGIHAKPCAFLDVEGYYAPLVRFLDHAVEEGFVTADRREAVIVEATPEALVERLLAC